MSTKSMIRAGKMALRHQDHTLIVEKHGPIVCAQEKDLKIKHFNTEIER